MYMYKYDYICIEIYTIYKIYIHVFAHLSFIVDGQKITTNHLRGVTGWSKVSENRATVPCWTIAKVAIRDTSQN